MNNPNFARDGRKIYTLNLVPGKKVYGEILVTVNDKEYRQWDPTRSKLAAAILKGSNAEIKEDDIVLYLGASSGTTPSHISDLTPKGFTFALDFAPRVVRELVYLCEERKNLAPILEDANKVEEVSKYVTQVDVVYQDVAQRNQAEIFLKNIEIFLKTGGIGMLAVKSRSIDITEKPQKIFNRIREQLKPHVKILEQINLDPFERDHCMFIVEKNR